MLNLREINKDNWIHSRKLNNCYERSKFLFRSFICGLYAMFVAVIDCKINSKAVEISYTTAFFYGFHYAL